MIGDIDNMCIDFIFGCFVGAMIICIPCLIMINKIKNVAIKAIKNSMLR